MSEGTWVRLCRVADIPDGLALALEIDSALTPDPRVCVVSDADRPQAMLDRCPHRDVRLSGGVVRDGLLTCPGHFWRFSLTDGRRTDLPDEVATLYPTRLDDDGWVWALIPPPPRKMSMRQWLLQQARAGTD